MKRKLIVFICLALLIFQGCVKNENTNSGILNIGDTISITGVIGYSDEPSDIGQEYCYVTGNKKLEYYYTDIYGEQSQFSSNVFYTKGNDTGMLKEYVGSKITVTGTLDAESHGIPYITDITVK